MSKKLKCWLSLIDDNSIDRVASELEVRIWLDNPESKTEEERDNLQREIYEELLKIKEG